MFDALENRVRVKEIVQGKTGVRKKPETRSIQNKLSTMARLEEI